MERKELIGGDIPTLARGALVVLGSRIAGRGLHILAQVVMARVLGPAEFGLYAVGWTLLRTVGVLTPLGLDVGVIRFAPRYLAVSAARLKGLILEVLTLALFFGLVVSAAAYFTAPLAARLLNDLEFVRVLRWFAPGFIFVAALQVAAATTRVRQRMKYSAIAEDLAQPGFNLLLFVGFYLLGWHLMGAVVATVVSFLVGFLIAFYFVWRLFPISPLRKPPPQFGSLEVLAFSVPASLASMLTLFTTRLDRLLVAYFRPTAEVGVYQAASQSAILFGVILSAFTTIFAPLIADLHHKNATKRLEELFRISTKWSLYASLPFFLVMVARPKLVMTGIFGESYAAGGTVLLLLAVAQLINAGTGATAPLLVITGHQRIWALISAGALVQNVVLNILLIPRLGAPGAALGSILSMLLLFGSGLAVVRRDIGIWPYDRRYWKGILAAFVTAAVLLALSRQLSLSLFSLVLISAVSVVTFSLTLFVLRIDPEDRVLLKAVWGRIRARPR